MNLLVIFIGLAAYCFVLHEFSQRFPPEQIPALRRWFRTWTIKGLLTPVLFWLLFNGAIWQALPPLMQRVQFAKLNGHWAEGFYAAAVLGLFVISTYWAALTTAWLLVVLRENVPSPQQYRSCILSWSVLLGPIALLMTWSFGWQMAGLAGCFWAIPILQQVAALQPDPKAVAVYTRAIAAMHFDKYEVAEQAVIEQLETHEDDFDGWLLLAELYANQFHDLPGAQNIINDICGQPATTASQFAVACHRLADWHLKLGNDPDAARAALEKICRRFPRSHLDHMARLRINQLPANREEWLAQQSVRKIKLTGLDGQKTYSEKAQSEQRTHQEAFARSQECIAQLTANPDDTATREELAHVWAEELGQIEMAVEQLELLMSMPRTPAAKMAEYLGLIAQWHLKFPQNIPAATAAMERLARQYPNAPQALAARRRLKVMEIESKMRAEAGTPRRGVRD